MSRYSVETSFQDATSSLLIMRIIQNHSCAFHLGQKYTILHQELTDHNRPKHICALIVGSINIVCK